MPELPEVESVKRGLEKIVIDKTISEVTIFWPNLIHTTEDLSLWKRKLENQTILGVLRRGKYLIFELGEHVLISHLRMEGKYFYFEEHVDKKAKHPHTHVIFYFEDGSELHYNDVRKFGRFYLLEASQQVDFFHSKKLGPEPTKDSFSKSHFKAQLKQTKRAIKTALLSQQFVVGLGNIYVDEVLFASNIHPEQPANLLSEEEINCLHQQIIRVLNHATQLGGSTIRTYKNALGECGQYQNHLKIYGKEGTTCPKCGTLIEKFRLHGRGTHFCPNCQAKAGVK